MNKLFLPLLAASLLTHVVFLLSFPVTRYPESFIEQNKVLTVRRVSLETPQIIESGGKNETFYDNNIPAEPNDLSETDSNQSVLEMIAGWEDAPVAEAHSAHGRTEAGISATLSERAITQPVPDYPEQARRNGWEGICTLEIHINGDGTIARVDILYSSGYTVLDDTCVNTVKRQWHFEGLETGGIIRKSFEFRLTDSPED